MNKNLLKSRLVVLGIAAIMAVSAVAMTGCGKKANKTAEKNNTNTVEEKMYTPTFMYFVSPNDADFEAEKALYEELKKEYDKEVNFALHNIEETPEDKDNFPVENNTPMLIMLDTKNNISAMEFQCSDKGILENRINAALNGEQ